MDPKRRSFLVATLAAALCLTSLARAQTTEPATPMPPAPVEKPAELDPKLPTLWIIGDSTVKVGTRGQQGWGDPLSEMFDKKKINVVNRAIGGRSSRTFQTEGRWDAVLAQLKAGDFVLMQFGHNDPSALAGDNRERGTIRGTGDESQEVTLTLGANKDKKEVVHSYGWYMRKYVKDAQAKGATPIVCSYIPRAPSTTRPINVDAPLTTYALWAQQVAEQEKAPFFDLFTAIQRHYATMSAEDVKKQYYTEGRDNTHTSPAGAKKNAEIVAEGIRGLKDVKLKDYLLEQR
jgi:rhamnogalacturonan acetylesterase